MSGPRLVAPKKASDAALTVRPKYGEIARTPGLPKSRKHRHRAAIIGGTDTSHVGRNNGPRRGTSLQPTSATKPKAPSWAAVWNERELPIFGPPRPAAAHPVAAERGQRRGLELRHGPRRRHLIRGHPLGNPTAPVRATSTAPSSRISATKAVTFEPEPASSKMKLAVVASTARAP